MNKRLIREMVVTLGPPLIVAGCALAAFPHFGYWTVIVVAFFLGVFLAAALRFSRTSSIQSRREALEAQRRFLISLVGWKRDPRLLLWVIRPALTLAVVVVVWALPDASSKPALVAMAAGLAFLEPRITANLIP
jgi:hypothetical protein